MNIRHFSNRVEITFWSVVISLLSEIPDLSNFTRPILGSWKRLLTPQIFKRAALWAISGWIAGFIVSLLFLWLA